MWSGLGLKIAGFLLLAFSGPTFDAFFPAIAMFFFGGMDICSVSEEVSSIKGDS